MTLIYSKRAERDLENIGDWIARDDPIRAVSFVGELRTACAELSEHPRLHRFAVGSRSVRRRLFGKYLIYFRQRRGNVFIVAIQHGAREQPRWQ